MTMNQPDDTVKFLTSQVLCLVVAVAAYVWRAQLTTMVSALVSSSNGAVCALNGALEFLSRTLDPDWQHHLLFLWGSAIVKYSFYDDRGCAFISELYMADKYGVVFTFACVAGIDLAVCVASIDTDVALLIDDKLNVRYLSSYISIWGEPVPVGASNDDILNMAARKRSALPLMAVKLKRTYASLTCGLIMSVNFVFHHNTSDEIEKAHSFVHIIAVGIFGLLGAYTIWLKGKYLGPKFVFDAVPRFVLLAVVYNFCGSIHARIGDELPLACRNSVQVVTITCGSLLLVAPLGDGQLLTTRYWRSLGICHINTLSLCTGVDVERMKRSLMHKGYGRLERIWPANMIWSPLRHEYNGD